MLGGLQLDVVLDLAQYRTEGARRADRLIFVSELVIPEHRLPVIDDTLYVGVRDGLIAEFFKQTTDEPLIDRLEQAMLCERMDIHLVHFGGYAEVLKALAAQMAWYSLSNSSYHSIFFQQLTIRCTSVSVMD